MNIVTTLVPVVTSGVLEHVVVVGRIPAGIGDKVRLVYRDTDRGDRHVIYRRVVRMRDIHFNDIDADTWGSLEEFWAKLEDAYRITLNGDHEITLIGLSREATVSRNYRPDYREDDYLEYEDEYGDYCTYEKIRRGRKQDA